MKQLLGLILGFILLCPEASRSQAEGQLLTYQEFLALVKQYHPVARQADLVLSEGEAKLLKARGGFDPNLEIDYATKEFKGSNYYDQLNTTFKIPTWYGIEFKGQWEQNEGDFLNPEASVPSEGLFSAGVTVSLGEGLWINERMATLKKARFFLEQSKIERDLQVNELLYKASLAYFEWLRAFQDFEVYGDFVDNAQVRYEAIKTSATSGVVAAIDSVEAKISLQNRILSKEQAWVTLQNKRLELSNYLWFENNIPVELREEVQPELRPEDAVSRNLGIALFSIDSIALENHPKIRAFDYKLRALKVDKRFMANRLLPQIDVSYNFLTETPETLNSFQTADYKGGLYFKLPLFLRKERGDLKLAKVKYEQTQWDREVTKLKLENKLNAISREIESLDRQRQLATEIVTNYDLLLRAEERKFSFGESSVFLLNSRERSLIDARLKVNQVQLKWLKAQANLFNQQALNPVLGP